MNTCIRCKKILEQEHFMKNGKVIKTCLTCREKSQSRNVILEKKVRTISPKRKGAEGAEGAEGTEYQKFFNLKEYCINENEIISELDSFIVEEEVKEISLYEKYLLANTIPPGC